ncbi:MAG: histidine phosphotransferase [Silicimonas sp.]|nr:histidine phosphotransferase [Silicimonas sp.]NND18870.1 histidine phosphotransferase [Silicimonas sp.]NND20988.1 histidine phosphotransferase [Silicimonas sp.]NNL36475.1 histidine phosphotransferase [Silicimonas sp.]
MINENALNDLIGSRICHDLISPLGAIGNGVELLSLSGSGAAREIALITESIENAHARIRYFRVAFGASSDAALIGETEVRSILRDMYRGSRLRVQWQIDQDLPRTEAKLAFLLIQCLETALPWGGSIRIARTPEGRWSLNATGDRMKLDPGLWDLISNPQSNTQVTASEVQFALVHALSRRMERQLRLSTDANAIAVSF